MSNNQLIIASTGIKQDAEGRYCLNDLHKAAGAAKKHQPSNWLRLDTTKDLIVEVSRSSDVRSAPASSIFGGREQGTYDCKELVYAYAMWISATFHLKVIRAYDEIVTQPQLEPQAPALPGDYLSALKAKQTINPALSLCSFASSCVVH